MEPSENRESTPLTEETTPSDQLTPAEIEELRADLRRNVREGKAYFREMLAQEAQDEEAKAQANKKARKAQD